MLNRTRITFGILTLSLGHPSLPKVRAISPVGPMVLFGKSFATALRAYLAAHPKNRYLFQTRLAGPFTSRRIEQIVKRMPRRSA